MSWQEIFDYISCVSPDGTTGSAPSNLNHYLRDLADIGAIKVFEDGNELNKYPYRNQERAMKCSFAWNPNFDSFLRALGVRLSDLGSLITTSSVVHPLFGQVLNETSHVYVIMPFRSDLDPVYETAIYPAVSGLGYACLRGDGHLSTHEIMRDVWHGICRSHVVIADLTGRNPNVFYELGIAHTIGKPVILICADHEDVPFDLRHLRHIQYSNSAPGLADLTETLRLTLQKTTT